MSIVSCVSLALVFVVFGVSSFAQTDQTSKAPQGGRRITMKASQAEAADYGILTVDSSGISYKCIRPGIDSSCSPAADRARPKTYSALEYCTFLDNRRSPARVLGGRPQGPGGLGPMMWVIVKAKTEPQERVYGIHDESAASFVDGARLFGSRCAPTCPGCQAAQPKPSQTPSAGPLPGPGSDWTRVDIDGRFTIDVPKTAQVSRYMGAVSLDGTITNEPVFQMHFSFAIPPRDVDLTAVHHEVLRIDGYPATIDRWRELPTSEDPRDDLRFQAYFAKLDDGRKLLFSANCTDTASQDLAERIVRTIRFLSKPKARPDPPPLSPASPRRSRPLARFNQDVDRVGGDRSRVDVAPLKPSRDESVRRSPRGKGRRFLLEPTPS